MLPIGMTGLLPVPIDRNSNEKSELADALRIGPNRVQGRLAFLRQNTQSNHKSIESAPALATLMMPEVSLCLYRSILIAMREFHRGVEPAIKHALAAMVPIAWMLDGSRICALTDDIAWIDCVVGSPLAVSAELGRSVIDAQSDQPFVLQRIASLNIEDLPSLTCPSEALGALYVIEGAGLGGRVIARHLSAHLGVKAGAGASFYGGLSAEQARHRWTALCTVIEADFEDEVANRYFGSIERAMLCGAQETFNCLERWLREIRVPAPGTSRPQLRQ